MATKAGESLVPSRYYVLRARCSPSRGVLYLPYTSHNLPAVPIPPHLPFSARFARAIPPARRHYPETFLGAETVSFAITLWRTVRLTLK